MSELNLNEKNEWGVDRFDMEDAMIQVAQSQEDLKLIMDNIYDGRTTFSVDKLANAVYGLVELMEARSRKMEEVFSKLLFLDHYSQMDLPADWNEWADRKVDDLNVVYDEGLIIEETNDGC